MSYVVLPRRGDQIAKAGRKKLQTELKCCLSLSHRICLYAKPQPELWTAVREKALVWICRYFSNCHASDASLWQGRAGVSCSPKDHVNTSPVVTISIATAGPTSLTSQPSLTTPRLWFGGTWKHEIFWLSCPHNSPNRHTLFILFLNSWGPKSSPSSCGQMIHLVKL